MATRPKNRAQTLAVVGGKGSPSAAPPDDSDWSTLMARAQDGDQNAYRRLLGEVVPYIRSLARRRLREAADVEDAVQDVLWTLHSIRHTYDPARPFTPWLATIAGRRIIDRLRRLGRTWAHEAVLTDEHETFPAAETNYHETVSDGRLLHEAIEELSPGQRTAIRLLKLEEMSLIDAAKASGMSVAALKVATHRALKVLRLRLTNWDDVP